MARGSVVKGLISLSYHTQHSSNLYNKAYFDTTPYQLNRESFYKMETFCMVVFGGEYVMTYCWRPGVPTRLTLANSHGPLNSHAGSGHNWLALIKM